MTDQGVHPTSGTSDGLSSPIYAGDDNIGQIVNKPVVGEGRPSFPPTVHPVGDFKCGTVLLVLKLQSQR